MLVVRHGETDWSRERRFTGSRDVPLNERGRRQSEAAALKLAPLAIAAVYASPLERSRATAEMIAKPHHLSVQIDPAFREMAFGEWEGLTRAELARRVPAADETWERTPHLAAPAGGERLSDVVVRVGEGLARVAPAHAGQNVVLVTHAIVARLLVLDALGLGPERLWSVDASPAGITEIEYEPGWVTVHRMNTVAHLEAIA